MPSSIEVVPCAERDLPRLFGLARGDFAPLPRPRSRSAREGSGSVVEQDIRPAREFYRRSGFVGIGAELFERVLPSAP